MGVWAWIVGAVALALFVLVLLNPLLGLILPRRVTGTAYLVKELRKYEVDPQQLGLPVLHEIVDDADKLSKYQAIARDKLRSEWFIANLESAAYEIARVLKTSGARDDRHFVHKVLIKHGLLQ